MRMILSASMASSDVMPSPVGYHEPSSTRVGELAPRRHVSSWIRCSLPESGLLRTALAYYLGESSPGRKSHWPGW